MQGTRNESIPPNPKTRLPHDVNPHTCKACNVGFRVTEGKRQNFIPRTPGKVRLVEVQAPMAMCYFNPRTPGGVRHAGGYEPANENGFQSTHPGWGATNKFRDVCQAAGISIHAPRVGCDLSF